MDTFVERYIPIFSLIISIYSLYCVKVQSKKSDELTKRSLRQSELAMITSIKQSLIDQRIEYYQRFVDIYNIYDQYQSDLYDSYSQKDRLANHDGDYVMNPHWFFKDITSVEDMENVSDILIQQGVDQLSELDDDSKVLYSKSSDMLLGFFKRGQYLFEIENFELIVHYIEKYLELLDSLIIYFKISSYVLRTTTSERERYDNAVKLNFRNVNPRLTRLEINERFSEYECRRDVLNSLDDLNKIVVQIEGLDLLNKMENVIRIKGV